MAPPKQKIPYELKNRREWDPNFVGEPLSDSGESESDTSSDEWVEGGIASESESTGGESSRNIASVPASRRSGGPEEDDGQGWQTVQTKGKTRPSNTPSRNNLPPQASRTNLQKYVHAQVSSQSLQTRRPAQAHHRRPVPVTRQRKVVPPDAKGNRLIKPFFNFARDNRAKTAYRQRKPPDGNYQLHKNPNEIEPDIKRLYDMLAEVGVRCNSFLIPPQSWNERNILIWGDTRALAKTRAALTDWLRRAEEGPVQRAKGKDAFTTENSTIGHLHKMELKRLRNEIELKSFQQVPDPGRHFEHQGWYPWRVEELDPKEVFGHSMEAFDTVRHECKCHIVFNDRLECFRIYTDCKDSVEHALSRIRGAHESIRQQSQYPIIKFMVNPPSATSALSQIQLSKSQPTKDTEQFSKIPRLSGPALDAKGRSTWDQQSRRSTADNQKWIEESFKKLWPRLKFYDGHLHMRIGFGQLQLRRFPLPDNVDTLPYDVFGAKIQVSGVKGNLAQLITGNLDAKLLMSLIYSATDLLSPENLSSQSLAESRPTFVGRFLIHRFDRPSIIYETILQPDSLDSIKYDIGASTWSRSDRKGAKAPLDFTMVQVDGCPSWQLRVATEHHLDSTKIDPVMREFPNRVDLNLRNIAGQHLTGKRVFTLKSSQTASLKPSEFNQRTIFRYRLKSLAFWVLEIARCDMYKNDDPVPSETRWEASMTNILWDATSAQNASQDIGRKAKWDLRREDVFPSPSSHDSSHVSTDASGVASFLNTVQDVSSLLKKISGSQPSSQSRDDGSTNGQQKSNWGQAKSLTPTTSRFG